VEIGMGAQVTILDINLDRMAELEDIFGNSIETLYSNPENIENACRNSDMIVGAVLIPGGAAPKLVRRADLAKMQPGTVLVDVAVDQGGCIETCKPTYHDDPTFIVDGIVHYCVANMPGAVPRTSTYALTNATLAYALDIANKGVEAAVQGNIHLARGVNTWDGKCTNEAVAKDCGHDFTELGSLF
jgi:alanine dehydrogenase